jgi:hypothetical protein
MTERLRLRLAQLARRAPEDGGQLQICPISGEPACRKDCQPWQFSLCHREARFAQCSIRETNFHERARGKASIIATLCAQASTAILGRIVMLCDFNGVTGRVSRQA